MGTPSQWGPPLWKEMHTRTFEYPENPNQSDRLRIKQYFHGVVQRIPCPACRIHYKAWLRFNPVENVSHNKYHLIKWLIDLHNEVNRRTGKRVWSYQEVWDLYSTGMPRDATRWLTMAALLVLVYILIHNKR